MACYARISVVARSFLVAFVAIALGACGGTGSGGGTSSSFVPVSQGGLPKANATPPSYTMTALPLLAKAINNVGVVVGQASSGAAAKFDHGTLTVFPEHAGSQGAQALDINDNGLAVGYDTSGTQTTEGCVVSAFLAIFHQDGTVSYVGPQPYPNAQLSGINNDGIATGLFGSNAVSYPPLTTVFQPTGGGLTAIGTAINGSGVIVGQYSVDALGNVKPFSVPAQPNCCGTATFGAATDINTTGHIVGYSYSNDPNADTAWFYANGTSTALPNLPGATTAAARALNDSDEVVGQQFIGTFAHGVLWKNGQVYDLNSLVTNRPASLEIEDASDINNSGQIVVFVCCGGASQSYLLTPQ
jgi:uncharacterized membrane protein